MKSRIAILLILTAAAALAAQAQPPARGARTLADMEPVLAQVARYHFGDSRVQQAQFIQFVQDSLGSPALLRQIEARLLKFLQSDATADGKDFAFRELGLIATNASIPVLAPMLTRPETAEMARYALARIPGPAAGEALRSSLDTATGNIKIGIINSLGQRRDAGSVPALAALISPSTPELTEAAAAALAGIADKAALDALAAARSKVSDPLREKYPLMMMTTHYVARSHSTFENVDYLREAHPQAIWMNPTDAKQRGIRNGDKVKVFNDRGEVHLPAYVTNRIRPGVTNMPQGAWYTPDANGVDTRGCGNVLTNYRPTPYAKGFTAHTNLVQVEKL